MPGATHDSKAITTSGVLEQIDPSCCTDDKGYIGTGVVTPCKKSPNGELTQAQKQANKALGRIRYVVEGTIAHIKAWKILAHDYRRPLHTLQRNHHSHTSPLHLHQPPNNLPCADIIRLYLISQNSTLSTTVQETPGTSHHGRPAPRALKWHESGMWVDLTSVTNMRIVMIMPSRNVYVAEDDVSLFTEASEIAGGLSAAVAEALRDYVKKHQRAGAGYEEIELALRTDGVDHRVTFMGRRLVRVSQPAPEGTRIDTVYQTAKNQLAVATKIQRKLPDWAAGQENLWSHPETWDRDFWVAGDKTMVVYPDIEHLGQVDGALAERVESALAIPPFEVLDI